MPHLTNKKFSLTLWGETFDDLWIEEVGPYVDLSSTMYRIWGDEGPFTTLTINMASYGLYPEPGKFFIPDWDEHHGLYAQLWMYAIVKDGTRINVQGPFGPLTVWETEFTEEFLAEAKGGVQ